MGNGTDLYEGMKIDPEALMGIPPTEILSRNGYSGELTPTQRVHTNQAWLGTLQCGACGVIGYEVLPVYRSEDIAKIAGVKPVEGMLVLPCTDCGTVFESYMGVNLAIPREVDEL